MTVLDRLIAARQRHDAELVANLTLAGMQHEIESGRFDQGTLKRIRSRFLDLTDNTPNLEGTAV